MEASQLDAMCSELITAATTLKSLYHRHPTDSAPRNDLSPESREQILTAEDSLRAAISRSTALLAQPRTLIFQLATHASSSWYRHTRKL